MGCQALYLWIILCVAQVTYSNESVLAETESKQESLTEANNASSSPSTKEEMYRLVENVTHSSTLALEQTGVENVGNGTLNETLPTSGISQLSESINETSVLASDASAETTDDTEQPQTKERTDVTTHSGMTESDMTTTITAPSTTAGRLESTEESDICIPDYCATPDHCIFVKSIGCIRLREGDVDKAFSYTITVSNKSSLIYVEMKTEDQDLLPSSTMTVEVEDCGKKSVLWVMRARKEIQKQNYVSAGPNLTLHISTEDQWTNFSVYYQELEFQSLVDEVDDSLDAGVLVPPAFSAFKGLRCRPNTRKTYLLTASKSRWNESSVLMTLSFVDLDELAGDYLLIGAGKKPYAGPSPLFFTGQVSKSRDYYIASDDVYVVYASGPSQRTDKAGFHIKWKRSGTAITKPEEEPEEETITDAVLQSVGICFYNKSFIAEFNRTEDYEGPLKTFRDELASVANDYAKQRNMDSMLTASSVEIVRVSWIINPIEDVMPEGGIYTMVTIVQHFDRNHAVFRQHQLEEIISQLEKKDEKNGYSILGFKVGQCPSVTSYFHWYLTAVLLVVIATAVLIFVWIYTSLSRWRGLGRDKRCSPTAVKMGYKEPHFLARENEYIRYTPGLVKPKLQLTTCNGDVNTLDSESLNLSRSEAEDASERVIFDQSWILKKRPSRKELPASMMASAESNPKRTFLQTFAAPLPITRSKGSGLLWKDMQMDSLLPKENPQPVDHEYDSLIFPSSSCLKKDEGETKL